DLHENPDVDRIERLLHERERMVAALCHGPAALLSVGEGHEGWLFDGYKMTAFTDEEEDQTQAGRLGMAWYLETALKNQGAVFDEGQELGEELRRALPDATLQVTRLFAGHDGTAVAEVFVDGTQADDLFGIVNQEKHVDVKTVWLLHVTDGRIDGIRAYWCQNQLYRRLGVKRLDRVTITA